MALIRSGAEQTQIDKKDTDTQKQYVFVFWRTISFHFICCCLSICELLLLSRIKDNDLSGEKVQLANFCGACFATIRVNVQLGQVHMWNRMFVEPLQIKSILIS